MDSETPSSGFKVSDFVKSFKEVATGKSALISKLQRKQSDEMQSLAFLAGQIVFKHESLLNKLQNIPHLAQDALELRCTTCDKEFLEIASSRNTDVRWMLHKIFEQWTAISIFNSNENGSEESYVLFEQFEKEMKSKYPLPKNYDFVSHLKPLETDGSIELVDLASFIDRMDKIGLENFDENLCNYALSLQKKGDFCVEYAASARAMCKICNQKIAKEAVRIGTTEKSKVSWNHMNCFFEKNSEPSFTAADFKGFSDLKSSDQEALLKYNSPKEKKRKAEGDANAPAKKQKMEEAAVRPFVIRLIQDNKKLVERWDKLEEEFPEGSDAIAASILNRTCSALCALKEVEIRGEVEKKLFNGKDVYYSLTEATYEVEVEDSRLISHLKEGSCWDTSAYTPASANVAVVNFDSD
eukprot:TRINITY_DN10803_c0_g1_i1.p1 TRINITY_DN10803_c0_g1~~TRINITY_DN10803_c0_g1_i1.p1  ORF type:complete len:474 (+),score=104.64 TRINITY_DN10803_c0_g1_i1:191-1423(+)